MINQKFAVLLIGLLYFINAKTFGQLSADEREYYRKLKAKHDTIPLKEFIYNRVSKNIYAYNLRNASMSLNRVLPDSILYNRTEFYNSILPDVGYKLVMKVDTTDLQYPDSRFKLYKIFVDGFSFDDGEVILRSSHYLVKGFLIAIDSSINPPAIKFISGQFYPTYISPDFRVNYNEPKSFLEYLRFRTYSNQVENIQFAKAEPKRLIFTGYSHRLKSNVKIIIKKDDLERPEIIEE